MSSGTGPARPAFGASERHGCEYNRNVRSIILMSTSSDGVRSPSAAVSAGATGLVAAMDAGTPPASGSMVLEPWDTTAAVAAPVRPAAASTPSADAMREIDLEQHKLHQAPLKHCRASSPGAGRFPLSCASAPRGRRSAAHWPPAKAPLDRAPRDAASRLTSVTLHSRRCGESRGWPSPDVGGCMGTDRSLFSLAAKRDRQDQAIASALGSMRHPVWTSVGCMARADH